MKYIFLVFRIVQTGRLVSSLNISSILRIDSCHVSARFSSIPHETKVTLRSAPDRMKNHPNHRSKHDRFNILKMTGYDRETNERSDRDQRILETIVRKMKSVVVQVAKEERNG